MPFFAPIRILAFVAAGIPQAGASEFLGGAEEVGILDQPAIAIFVRQQPGQRRFDLNPGHARGRHRQRMAHVDHRVQPGGEKVVGGHRMRSPKLSGTYSAWNQSREFALLAFTPQSERSRGLAVICRADSTMARPSTTKTWKHCANSPYLPAPVALVFSSSLGPPPPAPVRSQSVIGRGSFNSRRTTVCSGQRGSTCSGRRGVTMPWQAQHQRTLGTALPNRVARSF